MMKLKNFWIRNMFRGVESNWEQKLDASNVVKFWQNLMKFQLIFFGSLNYDTSLLGLVHNVVTISQMFMNTHRN